MEPTAEITKHYLISGRVQGVGYRAFTERNARQLNLRGWVRNLADGRVEALAKGPSVSLSELESRLRQGPPHGRVDAMLIDLRPMAETPVSFEVRKDSQEPCTN